MNWILDFDDTLVLGPNTWAFEVVLPEFIEQYSLNYEKSRFDHVMLEAQKRGSEDVSEADLLNYVFGELGWSDSLKDELIQRVFYGYIPIVFPETISFLQRLKSQGEHLFIVSNNNYADDIAQVLGIDVYFDGIYTPRTCQGARSKPHMDMWSFLLNEHGVPQETVQIIGDDPWADGTFSQRCGLSCWIIDRMGRYTSLHQQMPYKWIASLDEVSVFTSEVHTAA